MNQKDVENAWLRLSMHNSELLLENEELKRRLQQQSIWLILKARVRGWLRRGKL